MTEPDTLRCARHPDAATNLRCSKCEKPICPRCLVQTPVGARCPDCARSTTLPIYRVSANYYLKAAGAALAAGIVVGLLWGLIELLLPFFFFSLLLAAGAGYVIGETISRSVNRKRGTGLAFIGGLAVLLAFSLVYAMELNRFGFISFGLFRTLFSLASAGVGVYFAVNRLR